MHPFQGMGKCLNMAVKARTKINQNKAEVTDGSYYMQSKKFACSTVLESTRHILNSTKNQRKGTCYKIHKSFSTSFTPLVLIIDIIVVPSMLKNCSGNILEMQTYNKKFIHIYIYNNYILYVHLDILVSYILIK